MSFLLRFLGCIVLFSGLALVFNLDFLSTSAANFGGYQTIEKRVFWGSLLSIGFFLLFFSSWNSWKLILLALLIALTVGVITARVIGLVSDGFYLKQICWLLIEVMILIIFGFFIAQAQKKFNLTI